MHAEKEKTDPQANPNPKGVVQGQVSVYGSGINGPLLKSNDVRLIQIRNAQGELMSLFVRLTGDVWGFLTRGDPDWEENVRRVEVKDWGVEN